MPVDPNLETSQVLNPHRIDNFFASPFYIGRLEVPNRVLLAPLAGVSDVPFRRICQQQGAGLTYVEMLSATALRYKNKRTFEMMARHPSEKILGVQVTGPSAQEVEEAVGILDAVGFDTIDLNMGCPVKKVVGAGCGSAILKDQVRLLSTVEAARAATGLPLSIKVRLGYTRQELNVESTIENGLHGKCDMITVHGRTRSEGYDKPVDLPGIHVAVNKLRSLSHRNSFPLPGIDELPPAANPILPDSNTMPLAAANGTPLVGNGDVFCFASANRMVLETGCDAVMVSRGALGNPWVFKEILLGHSYRPCIVEWKDLVLQHIAWHEEHYGKTKLSAVLMRKHLLWYAKGFPGVKGLRDHFNVLENLDDARAMVRQYASTLNTETERYATSEARAYDPKYEMDREIDRGVGHLEMDDQAQR